MKKAVLGIILVFAAMFFIGCAKTSATDTFRFETREISVFVGEEKELGLIMGDNDKDSTIIYHMEAIDNYLGNPDIPACKIVSMNGYSSTYYLCDTTHGAREVLTVVGKMPGSVKIKAYIKGNENVTDTITVHVKKVQLDGFKINAPKTAINVGEELVLTTSTYPQTLNQDAKFYSENEAVCKVTSRGRVTAVGSGEAVICAVSSYDEEIIAKVKITVIPVVLQRIEMREAEGSVFLGGTYDTGLTFVPTKPDGELIVKVADETIVSATPEGIITGLKPGKTQVSYICAGKQAVINITVIGDFETEFECDENVPEAFEMTKGSEYEITYTVNPETSSQIAKVEVSDESILTYTVVDNKVTLKAVGVGVCKVYVSSPLGMFVKSYTVTVDYAPATSIKANPTTVNVKTGNNKDVKISVEPAGAKQEAAFEITSGGDFFTAELVNNEGSIVLTITGVAVGEGVIQIKDPDGTVSFDITVKVTE